MRALLTDGPMHETRMDLAPHIAEHGVLYVPLPAHLDPDRQYRPGRTQSVAIYKRPLRTRKLAKAEDRAGLLLFKYDRTVTAP